MGGWIDVDGWARRAHFALYRRMESPWFSVCTEVRITALRDACARSGAPSLSLASLHGALQAANGTEAFRLRIRPEGVWLHDRVAVSTTVLRPDDTFGFATLPAAETAAEFARRAEPAMRAARAEAGLEVEEGRDDLIYHSTLRWIRFTGLTNPRGSRDDSVPRLVFGQRFARDGEWWMPVAVEVHHALVDGLDVARFLERFQAALDAPVLE